MSDIKVIDEKFYNTDYYADKTSMFLKGSYGIIDHYGILCDIYKNLDDIWSQIINTNNILKNENDYEFKPSISKQLDFIGLTFGLRRNLTLKYVSNFDPTNPVYPTSESELVTIQNVTLSDKVFLIYIKCQLIKQHFNGTREELARLYNTDYDLNPNSSSRLIKLTFLYMPSTNSDNDIVNPVVSIYWTNYLQVYTDLTPDEQLQLRCLFLNGLLSIESLGINYKRTCLEISNISKFYNQELSSNSVFYTTTLGENKIIGVFG